MKGERQLQRLHQSLQAEERLQKFQISLEESPVFGLTWLVLRDETSVVVVITDAQLEADALRDRLKKLAFENAAAGRGSTRRKFQKNPAKGGLVAPVGLLFLGSGAAALVNALSDDSCVAVLDDGYRSEALFRAIEGLFSRVRLIRRVQRQTNLTTQVQTEMGGVTEIARALSQERDLSALLPLVLEKSRFITGADAGSIYLVEETVDHGRQLRFKTSENASVSFESSEFVVPISMTSIAGAAAMTRTPINIADANRIDPSIPFRFDASFDEKVGYRTGSMIAVPMVSAEGDVLGVIQLINKKQHAAALLDSQEAFEREVIPFDERSQALLVSLASQAGIAVENAKLYEEIQNIFEGFVRASVQAIEQRDPTTSGHSLRVSVLSCALAEVVDRVDKGPHGEASFSRKALKELEYAALLHDFGKIGVREQVLVKAKKLYPQQLAEIRARLAYADKAIEVEYLHKKLALIREGARRIVLEELEANFARRRGALAGALTVVLHANEPTVLSEGDFSALEELAHQAFRGPDGTVRPLLSPEEIASLQVTKGSLTHDEIGEIRSHVSHTIEFLNRIPWGKFMNQVPIIAGAHHEKLNGAGYPRGLTESEIPLPSKIMTVADIYDALTARDRPYKKAMSPERAIKILGFEVKDGHVDAELVRLFTEARVFESLGPETG